MAKLAAVANGNLTSSSTWALVDSTSYLNSESANTVLTTSYVSSSNFTPGAITIDGIGVKLATRSGTTGTFSIELYNASLGASVGGTEVTINTADMPNLNTAVNGSGGWVFFKFSSSVLLLAATNYNVRAKTSSASQINLFRDATSNNWSRYLRTTTTQAPVAGDDMIIAGEWTAAGSVTTRTVTMDSTAATDYGSNTTSTVTPALAICNNGALTYGATAATNYILRLSGNLCVYSIGTLNIGTVGSPIPRDSSAVLEFDSTNDDGMGIIAKVLSTVNMQGLSRTSGKNVVQCKLNTDEAIGQTVLGVDTDTGWLSGDTICIAPTTRTYTQFENRILSANANASDMTVTVGLTNAHSGTTPTQAEVGLLTRNVVVRSVSSTFMTVFSIFGATVDCDWVEFYYIGGTAAIPISQITGTSTVSFSYCSMHDCDGAIISASSASLVGSLSMSDCVLYRYSVNAGGQGIMVASSTNTFPVTLNNILIIGSGASGSYGIYASACGNTFSNLTVAGINSAGFAILSPSNPSGLTVSNLTIHSTNGNGMQFPGTGFMSATFTNTKIYRCTSQGILFNTGVSASNITFNTTSLFGNGTSNISVNDSTSVTTPFNITFNDLTSNGDSTFSTTNGMFFANTYTTNAINWVVNTGDFSTASGILTAHTNDINVNAATVELFLNNTKLSAATEITSTYTTMTNGSFIKSTKLDQTAGNHKSWFKYGIIQSDSTIYNTAAPSERVTPNNASKKIQSGSKLVAVNSGQTATPTVYIRKSAAGDGAAYTGNQPRLIVKANPAIGITTDTVLATYTAGTGAWNSISGTTAAATDDGIMEFVVDCDGTAGWINVDDYTCTLA